MSEKKCTFAADMEKFKDTFKRVWRYRVARKLLNLFIWLLAFVVAILLFILC